MRTSILFLQQQQQPSCCHARSSFLCMSASSFPNNYTASADTKPRNDTLVVVVEEGWQTTTASNTNHLNHNTSWPRALETLEATTSHPVEDPLSADDWQQIEQYWDQIMPVVNYLGTEKVAKIYQAVTVAYTAHKGQMRKSGEPFIIHPVQVAILLAGLKMDGETVIAGLLHDTVEDTEMTFDQIETLFGKTVRTIVEGETKVSKLPKMVAEYASNEDSSDLLMMQGKESHHHHDEQAENLRQMFVAMTEDYRIIIVKLADRLHNMRTLRHMKPLKQIKISRETLDIFAPLAHRMGIWQFKSELEDTAFMYLYPQEYKRLNRMLRQHQTKYRETLDKSQLVMQRRLDADSTLAQQAAKVEVQGRTKELYSLWHKMETKGVHNLDNIVDVVALRVVITPKNDAALEDENYESDRGVWLCYHVLGLVQHLPGFQPVPTRVKDYISFPKPNGYQSLHTALILNGQTIEVQIRTSYMHQVAEYGMASHWAYTDEKRRSPSSSRNPDGLYFTPWLSSIKEWQKDRISSRDFVDSVRRELLGKRVFVFLRNGKILNLARGATAIDAAFQIHTEVGLNMYRVEINGKPVSFSYELQNGDVVSILTGKGGKPSTDWMRYAKSRSTRSKLRSYFRARQRESLREAGHILLKDYLAIHGDLIAKESFFEFDVNVPKKVEDVARFLPGKTRFESLDDLLVSVGSLHDRDKLHRIISQLFEVPKRVLVEAEEARRLQVPSVMVSEALLSSRRRALESANAVSVTGANSSAFSSDPSWMHLQDENIGASLNHLLSGLGLKEEFADPDQVCEDCLPVYGDQIVGTCPEHSPDDEDNGIATIVHRVGCQHAQRAINKAQAELKGRKVDSKGIKALPIDSVSLRKQNGHVLDRQVSRRAKRHNRMDDAPVKLKWPELNENDSFLSEIVVHCQDRRLLLADCSEVVSEMVEIMRTGSQTTAEHATLVFLVKVNGIHQLQQLMDRLNEVRSVMSVERRFGSELM